MYTELIEMLKNNIFGFNTCLYSRYKSFVSFRICDNYKISILHQPIDKKYNILIQRIEPIVENFEESKTCDNYGDVINYINSIILNDKKYTILLRLEKLKRILF